jgi:hypothetical protein
MIARALSITVMLSLAVPSLAILSPATSALAQSLKPVIIECTTNGQSLSVMQNNPNPAEANCEYSCGYTAKDKQTHQTSNVQAIVRPGNRTSPMGRVDGEPPFANVTIKGSCTSWKCQATGGKLQCNDH